MSNPSDILILAPEETELKKVKGDCWRTPGFSGNRQVPGQYTFTNQRILFRGNWSSDVCSSDLKTAAHFCHRLRGYQYYQAL